MLEKWLAIRLSSDQPPFAYKSDDPCQARSHLHPVTDNRKLSHGTVCFRTRRTGIMLAVYPGMSNNRFVHQQQEDESFHWTALGLCVFALITHILWPGSFKSNQVIVGVDIVKKKEKKEKKEFLHGKRTERAGLHLSDFSGRVIKALCVEIPLWQMCKDSEATLRFSYVVDVG